MPFFKYLVPARVDVIEHCRIRFTPAECFNDPFECIPDSRLIDHPAWQKNIEDACVRQLLIEDESNATRLNVPRRWTETDIRRISRDRYRQTLPEKKQIATQILRVSRAPLRVLCLSLVPPEDNNAFLLWGHYTKNHEGIVIEFDSDHQWFKDHLPKEPEPHDADIVTYSSQRPGWAISDDGDAKPKREFIFTKSVHWVYEQEYRLVRVLNDSAPQRRTANWFDRILCNLGLCAGNSDMAASLVSFPPTAVVSVCFGVNATDETKRRVRIACRRPELRKVRIRQASIHPDEYRLVVTDV